jgi:diguanylate cyclase (GGDEF)-like protein
MRDSLTGLLNRGSFIDKFNDILRKSDLETQHALIMLDIDNFKTINDTLGHAAGDALLVNIAGKLKYALRSGDLCGRIGGDEFVICLKNMNLGKPLESRVNDLCTLVCNEQMNGISVSASFGIAGFSPTTASPLRSCIKKPISRCTRSNPRAAAASRCTIRS